MKTQILIILAITFVSFTGCKKDEPIEFNNEVMITLLNSGMGTSDTVTWVYPVSEPYFDISNYSNVKSAVLLVSNIRTSEIDSNNDVTGEGTWELYDLTNNKTIENSSVTSDDIPEGTYKSSSNFLNNIPGGKIKLGIRISSGGNYFVSCGNITLVLSK
ncbi:MAG TPA: hypothetical protein VIN10_15445 [Bacteroidales bacterium]